MVIDSTSQVINTYGMDEPALFALGFHQGQIAFECLLCC